MTATLRAANGQPRVRDPGAPRRLEFDTFDTAKSPRVKRVITTQTGWNGEIAFSSLVLHHPSMYRTRPCNSCTGPSLLTFARRRLQILTLQMTKHKTGHAHGPTG